MLGHDEHGEMGEELPEGESRTINDVLLPPWAKTAADFIEIHRQVNLVFIIVNIITKRLMCSTDSSVGRAEDCSGCLISLGRWFESGSVDFFLIFFPLFLPTFPSLRH